MDHKEKMKKNYENRMKVLKERTKKVIKRVNGKWKIIENNKQDSKRELWINYKYIYQWH